MMDGQITLEYGSGGRESRELIRELLLARFNNRLLTDLDDAAVFPLDTGKKRLAFTTDSYVVDPLFFPGGNIGKLAVCGTVNDLAVVGADPLYLSCGLIIEEGLDFGTLEKVIDSMAGWAGRAGVKIVTGDTKVVEKGSADKLFINTSGVGAIPDGFRLYPDEISPGDVIIVSGTIADHGLSILAAREELDIASQLISDCAPINRMAASMTASGKKIKFMRDPTRGGIAAIVNELAENKNWGVVLEESLLPFTPPARGALEILGLDPLSLASEGRLLAVADREDREALLEIMRRVPGGENAEIIGEIAAEPKGMAALRTAGGGTRIIDWPRGEQIPRIC